VEPDWTGGQLGNVAAADRAIEWLLLLLLLRHNAASFVTVIHRYIR